MWNPFRRRHVGVAAREHGEWLGGLPLFLKLTPLLDSNQRPAARRQLLFYPAELGEQTLQSCQ